MDANYNKIAWFYDLLGRMIFGNSLLHAQASLLKYIEPGSLILIAGGGTGAILDEIAAIHDRGLEIDYVEISSAMIQRARKRKWLENQVNFIQLPVLEFVTGKRYDVIITPFLFDNFNEITILSIFTHLDSLLKPGGRWLYTDFFLENGRGKFWQRALLKTMYSFFRLTCNIQASHLTDTESLFADHQYHDNYMAMHYAGFIKSIVYSK